MGLVTDIENDADFQPKLASAGTKLVVIHFSAQWAGPCQRIAPFFEQLAAKNPRAVFLKLEADDFPKTCEAHLVGVFPTFAFYRNQKKIDQQVGIDETTLENKVKQYYGTE